MTREQATLKAAGAEVPLIALSEPGFWALVLLAAALFVWWAGRRK